MIDLLKHIEKNDPPHFGFMNQKITKTRGWECLADMIKSKQHHKHFWEFVERLKGLRYTFNAIIDKKFRYLPRSLRKKDEIAEMFVLMKKKIAHCEESVNPVEEEFVHYEDETNTQGSRMFESDGGMSSARYSARRKAPSQKSSTIT